MSYIGVISYSFFLIIHSFIILFFRFRCDTVMSQVGRKLDKFEESLLDQMRVTRNVSDNVQNKIMEYSRANVQVAFNVKDVRLVKQKH